MRLKVWPLEGDTFLVSSRKGGKVTATKLVCPNITFTGDVGCHHMLLVLTCPGCHKLHQDLQRPRSGEKFVDGRFCRRVVGTCGYAHAVLLPAAQ